MLYKVLVVAALSGGFVESGYAPHYAPGLMEQVAHNRGIVPAPCMVSRPHGPLDTWVWVWGSRTGVLLRCKVVDVSHPRDVQRHIKTRRVVEIGHEVAQSLCGSTRGSVEECPVIVIGGI